MLRSSREVPILMAHVVLAERDQELHVIPTPVPLQKVADGSGAQRMNAVYRLGLSRVDYRRRRAVRPGTHCVYVDLGGHIEGPFAMVLTCELTGKQ